MGMISCIIFLLISSTSTSFSSPNNSNTKSFSKLSCTDTSNDAVSVDELLYQAEDYLSKQDPDNAFHLLAQVYSVDPNTPGLQRGFESFFRLRIEMADNGAVEDRFGLASLLIDQERHEEASTQLRAILNHRNLHGETETFLQRDKAISMLYRTQASACQWQTMENDAPELLSSIRRAISEHTNFLQSNENILDSASIPLPPVHPFEALKWPCIDLKDATDIAACYANRALVNAGKSPTTLPNYEKKESQAIAHASASDIDGNLLTRKIKVGYISPDFTSKHPLAFLMQDVFKHHSREHFVTHLYSCSSESISSTSQEISSIKSSADHWICSQNPNEMINAIQKDDLDILIDLCGFAGTANIADIMAKKLAPIQISYMGFPGSSGASYIDYVLVDQTVIPPITPTVSNDSLQHLMKYRKYYTESLIYMPHCYFVNCHKAVMRPLLISSRSEHEEMRCKYNLPLDAFVFCCHSRPDKIDPQTLRTWMRALKRIQSHNCKEESNGGVSKHKVVLWLLRSGQEMEENLRSIAETEYQLDPDVLIFCNVAPRNEHLKRLGLADLFLDTPAYNAHTLGCDSLYAGVPMISLLRNPKDEYLLELERNKEDKFDFVQAGDSVPTTKWVSRVGASLLKAAGLDKFIVSDLKEYEDLMVHSYTSQHWFGKIRNSLITNRDICPLFDTKRWVRNLEIGLHKAVQLYKKGETQSQPQDILILDSHDSDCP